MNNYNYGHIDIFWDLIIQALEDNKLTDENKFITIISPWIRNLSLSTSSYSTSNWRSLLRSERSVRMNSLSDVLGAMVKLGFQVNIIVLDSNDKNLPQNSRKWLRLESEFVSDLESCGVEVWKKIGEHAKMYAFPHGVFTGSTNCTNQGMLGNLENMTLYTQSDGENFIEAQNNARAIANGCVPYFDVLVNDIPQRLHIPYEEVPVPDESKVIDDNIQPNPEDVNNKDNYLHSPGIALGHFKNSAEDFGFYLNDFETICLSGHILSLEKELRRIIVDFYQSEGNRMKGWKQKKIDKNLQGQLRNLWTRLLVVNDEGQTLYEKAEKQIFELKNPPYQPEDFPNFKIPDRDELTPDTILTYGTYLSDLRTCIFGNTNKEFYDFDDVYLIDESLKVYTSKITGNKGMPEESAKYFWRRLFGVDEAFYHIAFARNELLHSKPLARSRAMKCQEGLLVFEKRLMRKFAEYLEG